MRFFIFRINIIILLSFLAGFSNLVSAEYFKVSNSGKALPASAALGSGADDWGCTYDSSTQLIWEIKTADGGLRDKKWAFTWYNSTVTAGGTGVASSPRDTITTCKTTGRCDTEKYTQDVNGQSLCGSRDWRLPTVDELGALVICPKGEGTALDHYACINWATDNQPIKINSIYFPNTPVEQWYWTSTSYALNPVATWHIDFLSGQRDNDNRSRTDFVRLVRNGQNFVPINTANEPPVAAFTATPTSGVKPLKVTLDASGSSDADGTITNYDWAGSDGQSASGKISSLTFSDAGTYAITLTVTDSGGATSQTSKNVTVTSEPNKSPVAAFTATPTSGNKPLKVTLDASGSSDTDGTITSYDWATSDGQSASGKNTILNFTAEGTYAITLTVKDNGGATSQKSTNVTVTSEPNKIPVAAFSATPNNGKAPLAVNLDASASSDSDGAISSYVWSSSDGQNAGGKTAGFIFNNVGSFTVTLIVTDNAGGKATLTKAVTVNSNTQAFFKISNSGNPLPDSAILGSGQNDWACTYDSRTNLIWEVKTNDQSLRGKDWTYTWYNSNSSDGNKGAISGTNNCGTPGRCDTETFVQDVNAQGLCGAKNWRLPSSDELRSLIYCSSNLPQTWNKQATFCEGDYQAPTVDLNFFPNTRSAWYSSATAHTLKPDNAWYVNFVNGSGGYDLKSGNNALRLVRDGQLFDYLNNPLGVYDDKTQILTLDAVSIDGDIYYLELQDIGNFQFKVITSRPLSNLNQATIADSNSDTFTLDIKLVLAYKKAFKVQMKLNALGLYTITKLTAA